MATTATMTQPTDAKVRLREVQSWDEAQVAQWLGSVDSGGYATVFIDNNITGKSLLDCDQQALRELGITKVGDRVRVLTAIKKLRSQCFEQKSSRQSSAASLLLVEKATTKVVTRPALTINSAGQLGASAMTRNQSNPAAVSPSRARSPIGAGTGTGNGGGESPLRSAVGSTTLLSNCVRFIGEQGQTRIVNISGCTSADEIFEKALKKFGLLESITGDPDHNVGNYCVYVVQEGASPRMLDDAEVLAACRDSTIPERERLILCKIQNAPSIAEIKQSHKIAVEQLELLKSTAHANNISKFKKIGGFFGDLPPHLHSAGSLPSPGNSPSHTVSTPHSATHRGTKARIKEFFGGRPPSELISSNLQDYFPDASTHMLEKTVRNSIRRSQRMSIVGSGPQSHMPGPPGSMAAKNRRYSTVSALSVNSSSHTLPTVGDAWISATSVPRPRRPGSLYRAPSIYSVRSRKSIGSKRSLPKPDDSQSALAPPMPSSSPMIEGSPINGATSRANSIRSSTSDLTQKGEDASGEESDYGVVDDEEEDEYDLPDYLKEKLASTEADDLSLTGELRKSISGAEDIVSSIRAAAEDTGPSLWHRGMLIGQGSFGSVVLGMNALTGELMAVKQVDLPRTHGDGVAQSRKKQMLRALQREIALLRDMQHENVVQYLGSNADETHLNIFLEYVPGGSVSKMLADYGAFKEPLVRQFVRQILAGLRYLHERDIIHRDIKGGNILVDNKGVIKISDFGISKKVEADLLEDDRTQADAVQRTKAQNRPSLQGSVYWMAPEVVRKQQYTRKADIWSLGCLIVEMFTGRHPYPDLDQMQAIYRIGGGFAADADRQDSPPSSAGTAASVATVRAQTVFESARDSTKLRAEDGEDDVGGLGSDFVDLLKITTPANPAAPLVPQGVSKDAGDFLNRTFNADLHKRPQASDLQQHPFCHAAVA